MNVTGVGARSSLAVKMLGDMRTQMGDLQRQLGTGKKSETYAGLGIDRGLAVGLRAKVSALKSYSDTTTQLSVRINLQQAALTRIADLGRSVKSSTLTQFTIDSGGQTATQRTAVTQLDEILGLLNTPAGDRYQFSGRAVDKPATDSLVHILDGDGAKAGFKQVMAERLQADLGVNGLGRLTLPATTSVAAAITGAGATLTADATASLAGINDLSGAFTSAAGGTLTINGTNVTINAGDDITAILSAINAPAVVAATGVTATAPGGLLTLAAADDDQAIDLAGSTGSLLTEFGIAAGPANPNTLLSQGAVTAGQTLTITIGTNTPLTVTFGTDELAVPPEVSTLAELNAALGTLTGGTASVGATGNISITAGNTSDAITIGGDATPANFGLATTSAVPSNPVAISEDAAGHPFGMKLSSIQSTVTGAVVTQPAGSPAAMSVDLHRQPLPDESVTFNFTLPDGTSEPLVLTATTSTTPGPREFTIGATLAATTASFKAVLNTSVGNLAASSMTAASAVAASHMFFDVDAGQPPKRVGGSPPFTGATTLVNGTASNTVTWYTGEMGTDPARGTAAAKVDDALSVTYGARANEQAIRSTIQNIAVYASMTYSTSDPNAQERFTAMSARVGAGLAVPNGQQKLQDIQAELAFAQTTMADAKERQAQRGMMLEDLLQSIEQAPQEEVATQILAMQTRLQASLQTTSILYKLSMVQFM